MSQIWKNRSIALISLVQFLTTSLFTKAEILGVRWLILWTEHQKTYQAAYLTLHLCSL